MTPRRKIIRRGDQTEQGSLPSASKRKLTNADNIAGVEVDGGLESATDIVDAGVCACPARKRFGALDVVWVAVVGWDRAFEFGADCALGSRNQDCPRHHYLIPVLLGGEGVVTCSRIAERAGEGGCAVNRGVAGE